MISHLEKELSGNSLLFPIGRNKDGSLSKTSHALPEELFRLVLSFAKRKEESVKDRMYDGEVSASPYEMGETTGCDYCPYRDICGFDPRLEGCSYRRLERYSSDDAVKKMREALEENVSRDASENEQSGKAGKDKNGREMDRTAAKVIDLRNRNILVSAAAGSGKTAVLVERIIQKITDEQSPVDVDRL